MRLTVTLRGEAEVSVLELRQNLSVYVRRVQEGRTLAVTSRGRRVALLAPIGGSGWTGSSPRDAGPWSFVAGARQAALEGGRAEVAGRVRS